MYCVGAITRSQSSPMIYSGIWWFDFRCALYKLDVQLQVGGFLRVPSDLRVEEPSVVGTGTQVNVTSFMSGSLGGTSFKSRSLDGATSKSESGGGTEGVSGTRTGVGLFADSGGVFTHVGVSTSWWWY